MEIAAPQTKRPVAEKPLLSLSQRTAFSRVRKGTGSTGVTTRALTDTAGVEHAAEGRANEFAATGH